VSVELLKEIYFGNVCYGIYW